MNQKYEKLKNLLQELFQLDQPDLDFGIYRIMHAKSAEVMKFLDEDLLPQVEAAFAQYKTADKSELEAQYRRAIEQAKELGFSNPEEAPKVKELKEKLDTVAVDTGALESEVYDHLYSFFRRYYSEGDFLSKRVYKPGVYAIPYEGEEVKLYWANYDQYYIKTSEYLRDYAFRLRPENTVNPMRVHFKLVDAAEGEHDNVKEVQGKERKFKLALDRPVSIESGELVIHFTYEPAQEKQKDLNAATEAAILALDDPAVVTWIELLGRKYRRADGTESDNTWLRIHLDRYTARNTFDYFIHKDLKAFLSRELDFYIKNEVMHLDDIESESAPKVEQYLSKIKVIRTIAGKIIDFLAQLEDFQKKLWLKKKFVTETSWCVRVGIVPKEFYPEIAANEAQWEEWKALHGLEGEVFASKGGDLFTSQAVPGTVEFLSAYPTLMIDTCHFSAGFTARLLDALDDIDEKTDGVLVHSENFQALNLMQRRYREKIKCVYIDPPYNTDSGDFLYKDDYQHSTWLSMMNDRLCIVAPILRPDTLAFIHIDEREQTRLDMLIQQLFGADNLLGPFVWIARVGKAVTERVLQVKHEYVMCARVSDKGRLELVKTDVANCRYKDERGGYDREQLRQWGGQHDRREDRPTLYFPIPTPFGIDVFPRRPDGSDGCWRASREQVAKMLEAGDLDFVQDSKTAEITVYRKIREGTVTISAPSNILDNCGTSTTATKEIKGLFFDKTFNTAKPIGLAKRIFQLIPDNLNAAILDYFAGSGTTGHAVINLNREDGGKRKFILVEMADYFDTVLLPRLKKVTFTPEWKDGKPKRLATTEEAERSPRVFKVIRLESYEDTLNNLELQRTPEQEDALFSTEAQGPGNLKEQYMLNYMLDVESRGSQSLLNIDAFKDPLSYTLKVKRPGSDESQDTTVDLMETFNWLIGLTVKEMSAPQRFDASFERDSEGRLRLKDWLRPVQNGRWWIRTVRGILPDDNQEALIIWRNLPGTPEEDNLILDEWFKKSDYSTKEKLPNYIYVNGTNNLENIRLPDTTWKVRLIEEDFMKLMFEEEERL
ncbi:MAG TPA: site-specific DNA-methyltransferase [Rectinema sp.]|nr:site-specific DNA-methyltransferase [Rectinema sp.]